jgi:hypothetical protein
MSSYGGVFIWKSHKKCAWTTRRVNLGAFRMLEKAKLSCLDARVGVSSGGVALEHDNTTI